MIELKIENVAETLINQAKLFNCTIDIAWSKYMHSYITNQFKLADVTNYIEDMQKDVVCLRQYFSLALRKRAFDG